MKLCRLCLRDSADERATCPYCGEATWGPSDGADEPATEAPVDPSTSDEGDDSGAPADASEDGEPLAEVELTDEPNEDLDAPDPEAVIVLDEVAHQDEPAPGADESASDERSSGGSRKRRRRGRR